jgi:hypothetical protein
MAQTLIWWVKKGNETPAKKVWVSHYGEVWYEKDIQIKTDLLDSQKIHITEDADFWYVYYKDILPSGMIEIAPPSKLPSNIVFWSSLGVTILAIICCLIGYLCKTWSTQHKFNISGFWLIFLSIFGFLVSGILSWINSGKNSRNGFANVNPST